MLQLTPLVPTQDCGTTQSNQQTQFQPEGIEGFNKLPDEVKVKIFRPLMKNGDLWVRGVDQYWKLMADAAIRCLWNKQLSKT